MAYSRLRIRQGSSVVEQRTHKPLVAGSTPAPGTSLRQAYGWQATHRSSVSGAETKVPAEALAKAGITAG